jgi:hypothetical protein
MARNLALKKKNNAPEPLSVASAAENVSNELDKVIHERMRLGIISALAANEKLSFSDLKNLSTPPTATSASTPANSKTPATSA